MINRLFGRFLHAKKLFFKNLLTFCGIEKENRGFKKKLLENINSR